MKWDGLSERDGAFQDFVRGLIALRKRYPLLHERNFLHGHEIDGNGTRDVVWFKPDGKEMDGGAWGDGNAKVVGLLLRSASERLLMLVSAWHDTIPFTLPSEDKRRWRLRADSGRGLIDPPATRSPAARRSTSRGGRSCSSPARNPDRERRS